MIEKAIQRAYQVMNERNWDKIYWAVDLHGVVLKSNYEQGGYEFINPQAMLALQLLTSREENVVILWSSCHEEEQNDIIYFLAENGIVVDYFNENPEVENTKTGCFDKKFYFSVLLDDKAGFEPDEDWSTIYRFMLKREWERIEETHLVSDLQSHKTHVKCATCKNKL